MGGGGTAPCFSPPLHPRRVPGPAPCEHGSSGRRMACGTYAGPMFASRRRPDMGRRRTDGHIDIFGGEKKKGGGIKRGPKSTSIPPTVSRKGTDRLRERRSTVECKKRIKKTLKEGESYVVARTEKEWCGSECPGQRERIQIPANIVDILTLLVEVFDFCVLFLFLFEVRYFVSQDLILFTLAPSLLVECFLFFFCTVPLLRFADVRTAMLNALVNLPSSDDDQSALTSSS